eukprot:CAMPEP_0197038088 /NCGR_PEP_ID=MMETSP1384-20130603/15115_1 /TAXON_ID=29189 /ORGANISM="Ammonia sp." /LENGTH=813 /DNA_ID=CAMNT_0042468481 /DNA_START=54 /DNA_END=2495 /DNA_ORIENTATION=+
MSSNKKKRVMDVMEVLKSVPLFSGLTDDERMKLSKGLKKKQFKQGDMLMKQGDDGSEFFIISEGKVEVSIDDNGKKITVATLEAGDYAGEQALLQNTKRNATLTAVSEKLLCLVCDQRLFKNILANNTSIKFEKREAKRKAFLTYINYDDIKQDDNKEKLPDKTIKWLLECVEENTLFESLNEKQRKNVLGQMTLITVQNKHAVINQGDEKEKATTFYVVESGEYDVLVDGVKVHHYARGGTFGELALLHNAPRAASVVCVSPEGGKLWEISRKHFRYALIQQQKQKRQQYLDFYNEVEIFKPLTTEKKRILNDILQEERYVNAAGTVVLKQGDAVDGSDGSKFYVIKKGQVEWRKKADDGTEETGTLGRGKYFGEKGFQTLKELQQKANGQQLSEKDLPTRAATISIHGQNEVILLSMEYDAYTRLLDSVDHIINAHIESAYGGDDSKANADGQSGGAAKDNKATSNGAAKATTTAPAKKRDICKLKELKTIGVLGKGGFGLVTLVQDPRTKKSYALKAIKKHQVIELELQKHIISEKQVMQQLNNQCAFLINLHQTYNDKLRVYFLLDVCLGGELFTILRSRRYFNEPTAMFFAASVCEGFAYMHSLDIIYRDLKPENLILDNRGYLRIADFGFAKKLSADEGYKTYTLCGTPDYLCPEIVTGQGHGKGCDWWTVGILIYEMLASFPPFVADEPIETYRKIIRGRIRFPRYFSQDVRDLIRGLLHNKPGRRLGVLMPKDPRFREPADVIRKHSWFKQFDWKALNEGTLEAPITNKVSNDTDLRNFAQIEIEDEDAKPIDKKIDFGHHFEEF